MFNMFRIQAFAAFILFAIGSAWLYQDSTKSLEDNANLSPSFPKSWEGEWVGELRVFRNGEIVDRVPTEMKIYQIEDSQRYQWKVEYLSDPKVSKPYELVVDNAERGEYTIDEGGVQLTATYVDGALITWFHFAPDVIIQSQYEMIGDELVMKLISGRVGELPDKTEKQTQAAQVKSIPINGFQKMILKRKNSP